MFFIVLFETTHGREQLDKILKNLFVNFYFWGITLNNICKCNIKIALFTDNILHLHYNEVERECQAISGKNDKVAWNCLVSIFNCIVRMQMSEVICEKGYRLLIKNEISTVRCWCFVADCAP